MKEPVTTELIAEIIDSEETDLVIQAGVKDLTFADCILAAQLRDEIYIGVRIFSQAKNKQCNFGIDLIPKFQRKLALTPNDALITLAKDKT